MPVMENRRRTLGRKTFRLGLLVAAASCAASTGWAQEPSAELIKALSFAPRQADVNFERVPEAEFKDCAIETVKRDSGTGFWVTGRGGQPLRWFCDSDGDNKLDRWSFYNAGVEVYRETDTDGNRKADEYRWLSTEGMRTGKDADEDGEIDAWDVISAEEVTAEVVRAAASRDSQQFARLLISADELKSLGLGPTKLAKLEQLVDDAEQQFGDWAAGQSVVTRSSKWTNFGADKPGIVPAGTDGSEKDVVVYENVVALLEDAGESRQLLVGTMVRVGNAWRLVGLPRAVTDGALLSDQGMFFSASFSARGSQGAAEVPTGGISKAMAGLVTDLQEIDEKLLGGTGNMEQLHAARASVLEKLVAESADPEDRTAWIRQFADTVNAAAQAGEFPGGVKRLQDFAGKLTRDGGSDSEVAYVLYRAMEADFRATMNTAEGDEFEQLQASYLTNLKSFARKYPTSTESADAMTQIALSSEFSGNLDDAKQWYGDAAKNFAGTLSGDKAAGALRRLSLEGQRFGIAGTTLDNRKFTSQALLGSPVVYHFWASWCESCKAEMRVLKGLQSKYASSGLKIVGINFDSSERDFADRKQFLAENEFQWLQVAEQGGLDGDLAVRYGVLTLPLNIIVDKTGKVTRVGLHSMEIDAAIQTMLK